MDEDFAPSVPIGAIDQLFDSFRLVHRVHLDFVLQGLQDDGLELWVSFFRIKNDRRCNEQAVFIIIVSDQQDILLQELSLTVVLSLWNDNVFFTLAHTDTIYEVGLGE